MSAEMMSLTVQQPWAWSILFAGKDVENRPQNLAKTYRGPLAIHAGLTMDLPAFAHPGINRAWDKFRREHPGPGIVGPLRVDSLYLDTGRILGVVDVVGSHQAGDCHKRINEMTLGEAEPLVIDVLCSSWADFDRYHIELANPRPLTVPLVYRGHQGIRPVPANVQREILARIPA